MCIALCGKNYSFKVKEENNSLLFNKNIVLPYKLFYAKNGKLREEDKKLEETPSLLKI